MSDRHLGEMADLQPVPEIRLTVETGSLPTEQRWWMCEPDPA